MYDLLIVGAGTAGMACAITAAQNGAKVGVIEKDNQIGGALHWSGGHMSAGGTRRQKTQGIEDSPEKHYADIIRINKGSGDLDLIKLAVEEAPSTIDWLEDIGFEFAPECPRIIYGHIPYDTKRTHYGVNKAISIYEVLYPLWDEQVENGHIELFLEHTMIGLEKVGKRFQKVLAHHNGMELKFSGKHIVLTTGGYGSAPDYFSEKHPKMPLVSSAYPTATADGHKIVEELGGEFKYGEHHIPSLAGIENPPQSGRANFNEAWSMTLTSVYRRPREIYVNSFGKRFMNEDEPNPDTRERIVTQQPGWKFWILFDEDALLERMENGMENSIMIGWDTKKIKAEAVKEESIFQADSINALSEKIGLPSDEIKKTIQVFNNNIDNGGEDKFGRTYLKNKIERAPFYAIHVHASVLVTFGGMKVNKDLQVVNKDGEVMEGLYGAGEFLGLGATSGSAFCSGMAITPALSFGRILGRKLVKESL